MLSLTKTNGSNRLTPANISFIYSGLSRRFRLINCIGGSLKKTLKFHTFLQLPCVFGKRFVFDSASQEMFMCTLSESEEAPLTNQTSSSQ